jgi:hypothetical protein
MISRPSHPDVTPAIRAVRAIALLVLAAASGGCVDRTLLIRSDPEGSEVYIDDRFVGRTPVEVPFTYGGEQRILLLGPSSPSGDVSYKPMVLIYDSERFEYDTPVVDVFAELAPWDTDDRQELSLTLRRSNARQRLAADRDSYFAALRARADTLRVRTRELQLGARPLGGGTDPGPLAVQPDTRSASAPTTPR